MERNGTIQSVAMVMLGGKGGEEWSCPISSHGNIGEVKAGGMELNILHHISMAYDKCPLQQAFSGERKCTGSHINLSTGERSFSKTNTQNNGCVKEDFGTL